MIQTVIAPTVSHFAYRDPFILGWRITYPICIPILSIDAWYRLIDNWPIAQYRRNSLVSGTGSVIINLCLAIPAAFALSRYEFKGREDIGFYILSTRMMAPAIVDVPILFLFRKLGLLATLLGLDAGLCRRQPQHREMDHPQLYVGYSLRTRGCRPHRLRP